MNVKIRNVQNYIGTYCIKEISEQKSRRISFLQ